MGDIMQGIEIDSNFIKDFVYQFNKLERFGREKYTTVHESFKLYSGFIILNAVFKLAHVNGDIRNYNIMPDQCKDLNTSYVDQANIQLCFDKLSSEAYQIGDHVKTKIIFEMLSRDKLIKNLIFSYLDYCQYSSL